MAQSNVQYAKAKEMAEEIQRLPLEAQRTIMTMLHGAIAISDMYQGGRDRGQSAARPSA